MNFTRLFDRRMLLKAGSVLGGLSAVFGRSPAADAQARNDSLVSEAPSDGARMADVPFSPNAKVTVLAPRPDRSDRHQSTLHPQSDRSGDLRKIGPGLLPV